MVDAWNSGGEQNCCNYQLWINEDGEEENEGENSLWKGWGSEFLQQHATFVSFIDFINFQYFDVTAISKTGLETINDYLPSHV